jgi:hypothetical protein
MATDRSKRLLGVETLNRRQRHGLSQHPALAFPEDSEGFSTIKLQRLKRDESRSRSDTRQLGHLCAGRAGVPAPRSHPVRRGVVIRHVSRVKGRLLSEQEVHLARAAAPASYDRSLIPHALPGTNNYEQQPRPEPAAIRECRVAAEDQPHEILENRLLDRGALQFRNDAAVDLAILHAREDVVDVLQIVPGGAGASGATEVGMAPSHLDIIPGDSDAGRPRSRCHSTWRTGCRGRATRPR